MFKTSLLNLSLRGITLASKFVLLIFIASRMAPEDLGVFGLMTVTIGISLYLVGMDFYVFNTREILARDENERARLIRDQLVFHGLMYVVVMPLLLSVFLVDLLSWKYLGWFYALLVLEHLSQESSRLLVTLSKPTASSTVLFIRSGIWVYAVVAITVLTNKTISLPFIWSVWCIGGFSSLMLTAWVLRKQPWSRVFRLPVDWSWLKLGMTGSLPFFGSTVALLGIQYADRYFLKTYHGEAMVGVYTFFANIANMIQVFVFSGVIMLLYPKLVSAYQSGKIDEYRTLMRKMTIGILGGVVLLSGAAAAGILPALYLVNKEIYADHLYIFWVMLGTVTLLTISYIPHYALYVRKADRMIIGTTVSALVIALAANLLLVPGYGVRGAAWATLGSMGTLCLMKFVALGRVVRSERQQPNHAREIKPARKESPELDRTYCLETVSEVSGSKQYTVGS